MAVTLKTWGEQLADMQTAISEVLVNQHYEVGGRVFRKADLNSMRIREQFLIGKLENEGDVVAGSQISRASAQVSFS